jgi:anti-sigma regulatory factor (Ser/Thr protein kinase)/NAD-dependent dihydropyrimidine dehydrogenase PreA subunit
MNPTSYPIQGGDYQQAGSASRSLKEQLKRIGADPAAIRRAMIAAYEAEMNVVIHARRGTMKATLDEHRLDVEVVDDGPGIADIDLAMKPGYSTAPAAARELGFGAGMGLPNIRKNSDLFAIESNVGKGTRVRFVIRLAAQDALAAGRHSLRIAAGRCRQCFKCVRTCPTGALRVRRDGPAVLEHLCIDCAACLDVCHAGAIGLAGAAEGLPSGDGAVLVIPPAMLAQFGPGAGPDRVLAALAEMGFRDVRVTRAWADALRSAVVELALGGADGRPVISPACPAAVNLIQTRFPSLLGQVAPFEPPVVAARDGLAGRRGVFVVSCPGERTALDAAGVAGAEIVLPAVLCAAVLPRVIGAAGGSPAQPAPPDRPGDGQLLCVTGISHVLRVLEGVENGLMADVAALELYVCDEGCPGSPLMREDPFVALHRLPGMAGGGAAAAVAVRRRMPLDARPGLRLDSDMGRAIEKLARIEAVLKTLPGIDCGLCGSPTCAALAEDIVMGRADGAVCVRQAK